MDRGETAFVACIHRLQHIERFRAAAFADDDAVRPHTQGVFHQVTRGDLALAFVWFLLGFALYAFLFAASAALVDKVTEASSAVAPVTTVLVIGYLLSVVVVMGDPSGAWGTAISMFPLSAPMAMPIRWSGGDVPVWQLVTSMALTAATAVLLVAAGAAVYRRALVITGHRVRWRELVGA